MRSTTGTTSSRAPSVLASFGDVVHDFLRSLLDPYRPELHYMRGPGPKWHAKHDHFQPELVPVRVKR